MLRKQVRLQRRHQLLLERLAQSRGVSQAEIVRQAIENEAIRESPARFSGEHTAWEEILTFVAERKALASPEASVCWRRQDAYQERDMRYD